ncbi:MAG: PhzF family phenazine biosynthesis protein [Solirubrobacteraceae bacterium]
MRAELHVLRVFCDEQERAGNLLGVFPQGWLVPAAERQEVARRLGFSETVFVTDADTATLEIYTPTQELPFAGHPLVGTAWLLGQSPEPPALLRPPVGDVHYTFEDSLTWVQARAEYSPNWELVQLPEPAAVTNLSGPPDGLGHVQAWAWQDQDEGVVRARVFSSDYGVAEDSATGSAAIALCASLGRGLQILQGQAQSESEIRARPLADGWFALGGRVVVDRSPEYLQLQG